MGSSPVAGSLRIGPLLVTVPAGLEPEVGRCDDYVSYAFRVGATRYVLVDNRCLGPRLVINGPQPFWYSDLPLRPETASFLPPGFSVRRA